MKRYETFADGIAQRIERGDLRPGDRLPSVREASQRMRLSPSTVFQGYYLLEDRGLVEARARSGYYVRAPRAAAPREAEPAISAPPALARPVAVPPLIRQVLGQLQDRALVPLGSAFPSPTLFPREALHRATARAMRTSDPWASAGDLGAGSAELRRQIALRYLGDGVQVDAGEIVVTSGAMEALNLCLDAVTVPGDLVAIESPTFYGALQALERRGLRAVEVATHPRHGVDLGALREALDRHPVKACWFMTSFQNPLGGLMTVEAKEALVALLAARGVPLIEDDVYGELYFGTAKPPSAKRFDREGLVLHCSSFSKTLAPGFRVGWTAAGRFAEAVSLRKFTGSLGVSVPAQEGISAYLHHGGFDRHLRRLRERLQTSRDDALAAVARWFPPGTRVTRPEGGYFLWAELPETVDALQLHRLALSQNVSLAPGPLFSPDQRFRHAVRLNTGHADDPRVPAALKTLGRLARSLAGASLV